MVAQPNSSAMRTAAMYILHWSRICASVSSVSSFLPETELHAFLQQPIADGAGFVVGDFAHGGDRARTG